MNIQIVHELTDITEHVISYRRQQTVCDGIGTFTLDTPLSASLGFDTWDYIELTEDGNLKGKYFIATITENIPKGIVTVDCQDRSKRLTDYFLDSIYTVGNNDYTKGWITTILEEAGVNSYEFTDVGNGSRMTPETAIGLDSAYNIIMTLLQQSGWYMYFDNTGKAIIGNLNRDPSPSATLNSDDILELSRVINDSTSRNKAIVWGQYNSVFGAWVTASAEKRTSWQIDNKDIRTVLISSSYINDYYTAGSLASTILNEFSVLLDEKTLSVHGARNLELADTVYVDNNVYEGTGTITTIESEMSKNGLITRLILDEKCPRLFGFYDDGGDYVYVSSTLQGVWRKPLNSDTWQNYSAGLDDFNITDLAIRNGRFVCVGASGYAFTRNITDSYWSKVYPGTVTYSGDSYPESTIKAVACAINNSNQIKIGYTAISGSRSWLYTDGVIENIVTAENSEITIIDIDAQIDDIAIGETDNYIYYTWSGGDPFPGLSDMQNYENHVAAATNNYPNIVSLPFTDTSGILYYGTHYTNDYVNVGFRQRMLVNAEGEQEWWGVGGFGASLKRAVPVDNYLSDFDYTSYNYTGATAQAFYVDFSNDTAYTLSISLSDPISLSGTACIIDLIENTYTSTSISGTDIWSGYSIHYYYESTMTGFLGFRGQSGIYYYVPVLIDDPIYGWAVGYYKISILTGEFTCYEFDRVPIGTCDVASIRILGGGVEDGGDYGLFYGKSIIWDGTSYCTRSFHYKSQSINSVNTYFDKQTTWVNRVYINEWSPTDHQGHRTCTQPSCFMASRIHYDPDLDGGRMQRIAGLLQADRSINVIDYTPGYIPAGYYNYSMYVSSNTYWYSNDHIESTATGTPLLIFVHKQLVPGTDTIDSSAVTTEFNLKIFSGETLAPLVSTTADFTSWNIYSNTSYFYLLGTMDTINNRLLASMTGVLRPFTVDAESGQIFNMYVGGFGNYGNPFVQIPSYVGNSFMYPSSNINRDGETVVWTSAPLLYYTYWRSANNVLKKIGPNLFTNIYNGDVDKIEMSQITPTVVFRQAADTGLLSQISSHVALSWTNASGSFNAIPSGFPAKDLRTFNLGEYTQNAVYSGYSQYLGITAGNNVRKAPIPYSGGWTIMFSGVDPTARFETSNFAERPYMFTNLINNPSGFYQQDANTTIWSPSSIAFPSGSITSIRVDDRI